MHCVRRRGSGEQASRCPASQLKPPTRHHRRAAHRHLMDRHSGSVPRVPRWTGGRERPRPPGRRAGERQRSAVRQPRHPVSNRQRPAGLLYVPKMSASRLATGSRPVSCGRSTRWAFVSRRPRWSPQPRRCSNRRHRGPVVMDAVVSNRNPDGFASLSVPVSCGSGGPIPFGSRKPASGLSVITNVTLTTRSCKSEATSPSLPGTMIRPSCLRHDGAVRHSTTAALVVSSTSGPASHARRCAALLPNSTTAHLWSPVVSQRWSHSPTRATGKPSPPAEPV